MTKPQRSSDWQGDECQPRWATARDLTRDTLGPQICNAMEELGQEPMPWQRQVAEVLGEIDDDGLPIYRSGAFSTPRQSGKTTALLGFIGQRAVGWTHRLGKPQRIKFSAQTAQDARRKLLDDFVPLLERATPPIRPAKITRANGNESVRWKNGSIMDLLASLEDSGHGSIVDLALVDEQFSDRDHRRAQSLTPAMSTRAHAQLIACSTMGTPDSIAWNQTVQRGRAAVDGAKQRGMAYFEWSAPIDCDPADPAVWRACMPALGRTISLQVIEQAFESLPLGEFKRAFLNIQTTADEQVIPQLDWEAIQSTTAEPTAACFALDVNPERTQAGFVAAGGNLLEVVDYQLGTGWVVARGRHLADKYGVPIVGDGTGPAAGLLADLEQEGVEIVRLNAREMAMGCGRFYDGVIDHQLIVRADPDLDRAVAGAVKRIVGDSWVWGRKSSRVDICLLVAATCAHWYASRGGRESEFFLL